MKNRTVIEFANGSKITFRNTFVSEETIRSMKEFTGAWEAIRHMGVPQCTPSREVVLTGYNVTEEYKQLEKVEVEIESLV